MTGFVRQWLLGVVAAALAAALADCLISQASLRRLARLAGGVLMALALLRPLGTLAGVSLSLEDWRGRREALEAQYRSAQDETLTAIIEEETAAYIVDKAAELGLETRVRVRAAERGASLEVWLTIPRAEALARWLEETLSIPAEAQHWR